MQTVVDLTWSGGGLDGNWTNLANWVGSTVAAGDRLHFSGSSWLLATDDFDANTQFNGLTFNADAGAFTLDGSNAVDLGGDVTNNSTRLQTINLPVLIGADRALNAASGDLAIGGSISETDGSFGLLINGPAR